MQGCELAGVVAVDVAVLLEFRVPVTTTFVSVVVVAVVVPLVEMVVLAAVVVVKVVWETLSPTVIVVV